MYYYYMCIRLELYSYRVLDIMILTLDSLYLYIRNNVVLIHISLYLSFNT